MSVNNNFHDNSKVVNFRQNNRTRSESDEESKKNKKSSKSSNIYEDSKPKLDESTSSLENGSYNAIPQYDVEKPALVVIFNQEKFENEEKKRVGTEEDAEALKKNFSDTDHFEVIYKKDKPKKIVEKELARVAKDEEYKDHSYIIIIFLSHGNSEGIIRLSSGGDITNEEIWQPFCSVDSIWRNKPKLFIFQACKGSEFTAVDIDNVNQPGTEVYTDIGKRHKMVPKEADILVGYSTVEGNVSIRPASGTWYIQNLCKIINKYGKCEDILDILTRVNHEIANNCEVSGSCITKIPIQLRDKTIKQMPMFFSTLTKKFYFYSPANRS